VPELLEHVANAVQSRRTGDRAPLKEALDFYAIERLGQGYDLAQVAAELGLLREVLVEMWLAEHGGNRPLQESLRLDVVLDRIVARVLSAFVRARQRSLDGLDRISAAALECEGTGQTREISGVAAARVLRTELCEACGLMACDECGGTGVTVAERLLRVRIPPGIQSGDQLRVAGEGGVGDPDAPAGDLLLDLTVKPEPRDPQLIRYLALAGMLAATALLVAYVLLS
jgi:hypothetical protein